MWSVDIEFRLDRIFSGKVVTHRDATMIEEGVAFAVGLDRRLDAEVDDEGMAARMRAEAKRLSPHESVRVAPDGDDPARRAVARLAARSVPRRS